MTNAENQKLYKTYLRRIQRCRKELPCLVCKEEKMPNEFKKHFVSVHRHLENTCCWCLKYSWPAQEKTRHAKHLLECFKRLLLNFNVSSKNPESSNIAGLNRFQIKLSRMNSRYICPWQNFSCSQQMKPGEMEKHFKIEHSPFDPTMSCVWCEGAVFWPRGQKNYHVDHLTSCFKNYCQKEKELRRIETASCSHDFTPQENINAAHFSNYDCFQYVENFLGKEKVLPHSDVAYKRVIENYQHCTWFPSSLPDTHIVPFENGIDISRFFVDCFRYMNPVSKDYDWNYTKGNEMPETSITWFHVMISAYAFEKFLQAVKAFGEDKVFALPFWCWCDGGEYEKAIFRHHRHMILVVKNGWKFKTKCWNRLSRAVHNKQYKKKKKNAMEEEAQEPLPKKFLFGRSTVIKTWLHLANTMRYVSLPQSGCQYHFENLSEREEDEDLSENETIHESQTFKNKKMKQKIQSQRHYFMGSGWHPMQMLCLALSAGGLHALLHQENKCRSKSLDIECIFRWPPNKKNAPWCIRLGNLMKEREIVLPVKKCWRPVKVIAANERWLPNKNEQAFLHLMDGDKLLFEKDDSLLTLSDDEWSQVQKEGGNFFYNVIADYCWKLSRTQQKIFNTGQRMVEVNNKKWEEKMNQLEKEKKEDEKQWELKMKELKKDRELLQKDRELLQKDKKLLQKDYELLQKDYELLKKQIFISTQLDEEKVLNQRKKDNDGSAKINCSNVFNFNKVE